MSGPSSPDSSSGDDDGADAGAPSRPRGQRWDGWGLFARDLGRLLVAVSRDDRVPWRAKAVAGAAAAYVASPIDLIPAAVPVVGWLDDIVVVTAALRFLLNRAGYEIIHELWHGTDDGFALVLFLGGVER